MTVRSSAHLFSDVSSVNPRTTRSVVTDGNVILFVSQRKYLASIMHKLRDGTDTISLER